jgi:hypothetical protein
MFHGRPGICQPLFRRMPLNTLSGSSRRLPLHPVEEALQRAVDLRLL